MSDLRERLARLRREPPTAALDQLEATLVGEAADGLSLKARLERLIAVAARGRGGWARTAEPPARIEDLVPGRAVRNADGEFLLVEEEVHLESLHGDVPLTRVRALAPGSVRVLSGEPEHADFDLARAAFLDTETTGLSGGAGTAAFLVGLGHVQGERFRVRQYFMRDYNEEPALLSALEKDLRTFSEVVTYNGKIFDLPLLETRFGLNRRRSPLGAMRHLDLLHPARRLWKLRLESCRLQFLEASLLGLRRRGDVPGEDIPRLYFEYVRSRDPRWMPRILRHNRLDVVSLAALAVLACQWVEEGRADDPRDVFSLGRVFERAGLYQRSEDAYRRASGQDAGTLRGAALLRLAERRRRVGDQAAALGHWERAAADGEPEAFRALAIHHEHRRRDPRTALGIVEAGREALLGRGDPAARRTLEDLARRRRRLLAKLGLEEVHEVLDHHRLLEDRDPLPLGGGDQRRVLVAGQDGDRQGGDLLAQRHRQRGAVPPRHDQVEESRVVGGRGGPGQGLLGRAGGVDPVAAPGQRAGQHGGDLRIVVDDEDQRAGRGHVAVRRRPGRGRP
jgi:hypothetical protein